MKVQGKPRPVPSLTEQIIKAIRSVEHYQYRSAPGLSQQTGIPIEHMEHYLVVLAQKGMVSIGRDRQNILWVQLGNEDK